MKNNYQNKVLYPYNTFKIFTLLIALCLGSWSSFAQDTCAGAQVVTAGTYTISSINGTNINIGCSTSNNAEWYAYTPTQNLTVTVSSDLQANVCGDTNFYIYTGTCGSLTCFVGDDDSGTITCPQGGTTYLSKKTFSASAGVTYFIAWDNRYNSNGFVFEITEAPYVPNPCETATLVTAGITTIDAINSPNVATQCNNASLAEWFKYVPDQNYRITISSDLIQNICKNTYFQVYRGACPGGLVCVTNDDNSGVIACNSGNTLSNLSKKTFDVEAGVTYYIAWDGRWSTAGFDFEITEQIVNYPVTYTSQVISTVTGTYNNCIVDMNNDGRDDLVGVNGNNLRIHYQGADGTLINTNYVVTGPTKAPSWSIAAGDYNKDGFNDLVLGDHNGLSFWTANNNGTAYTSSTPGEYIFCQRTNFVDLNHDGHLDAFSCHDVDPNVYYLNDGAGNLTYYQSGITPGAYNLGIIMSGGNYASIWSDLDNDNDVDLFISKCSGPPCEIHRNDGNSFTDISALAQINVTPIQSWSSAVADFDNDGDMDILIGSNGSTNSILFRNNLDTTNNTEEAYTNISAGSGWDTDEDTNRDYIAYDFDNDGFVDVMGSGNKIMFNQGNNTFIPTEYSNLSVGAIGDLNSDGFLDIQMGNTIKYAVPNGNKWVVVKLKGIQSNSNGIGARVEIYGSWGKQIRDVRSGEGFEYMSTLNTHFGLGTATAIEKIVIKWPSGVVDTILNPAVNQAVQVVEGSTLGKGGFNYNSFSVYPNPADDMLTIQLKETMATVQSAEVYDLNGRLVLNPAVTANSISVKTLSAGTYLLVIKTTDGKIATQKFLKK